MFKEEKQKCVKHLVLVERCSEDEEMLVQLLCMYNLLSNDNRPPTTRYELMFQINKRYRMDLQNVKLVQFFHIVSWDTFGIRNLSSSEEERKSYMVHCRLSTIQSIKTNALYGYEYVNPINEAFLYWCSSLFALKCNFPFSMGKNMHVCNLNTAKRQTVVYIALGLPSFVHYIDATENLKI